MTRTAHLVTFSPTGTTRKVCQAIARGLDAQTVASHDITLPGSDLATALTDGVAVIGVPVYAGRVPKLCLERLQGLTAQQTPAILAALYGNRDFDDALVELRDLAIDKGFTVIAAGAFIGEHSFATPTQPIASGRPDSADLQQAEQFGRQAAAKLAAGQLHTPAIDGRVPYKERPAFGGKAPQSVSMRCLRCGTCAAVCPAGAISVAGTVITAAQDCILCCACVRACETQARAFNHPWMEEKRTILHTRCHVPQTPKIFI